MHPVDLSECDRLFSPLLRMPGGEVLRASLAVSGGSDSTAMMLLAARWRDATGLPADALDVVTIDHGLRPGSNAEAEGVARVARTLGYTATVVRWQTPAVARIQEEARAARYALIAAHVRATGRSAVVTAHTQDDQAETLLMRLARGSGVDGLAAMQPVATIAGLRILRPLLGVTKARLVATLDAAGLCWIEDPSNASPLFERVRFRAEQPALQRLGLTPGAVAMSARRLGRARQALDWMTRELLADRASVRVSPLGYVDIPLLTWTAWPEEIRLRVLCRVLGSVGGGGATAVSLAAAESLADAVNAPDFRRRSLARCLIARRRGALLIVREPGRYPPAAERLEPGRSLDFDGRFRISLAASAAEGLSVAPAGFAGGQRARDIGLAASGAPAAAVRTAPALVADGQFQALAVDGDPKAAAMGCSARFLGPGS